jgi:iron(III) transport system ATP-binding protein
MTTPVSLRSLSKSYGPGAPAVDRVDLDINTGELFFLLGPSGCGKTTLLRMIAGFIEPTLGRIGFGERDVTHTPPNARNTGMVFQSYALWPHMTVEQNVAFGLDVRKVPRQDKASAVAQALRAVQMLDYADRKPTQLSGGQQQRVALARALVIRPDVLLLDEPLSNLDAKLRNDLRLEIRRICKESGLTTVYVTHDQKEALSIADRIAIMDKGRLVQVGTPRELYRQPASTFVAGFLGEVNTIEATVIAADPGTPLILQTRAGKLRARVKPGAKFTADQSVICLVRPEAISLTDTPAEGDLSGTWRGSVYLGDLAHHDVMVGAGDLGQLLRVSEINPAPTLATGVGKRVAVRIDPDDVVVLPAESAAAGGPPRLTEAAMGA